MSVSFWGNLDPQFNPFAEDELSEIVRIAAMAWKSMKQPPKSELEDNITFRVAGRIALDPDFAESPYDVVTQFWILGLDGQRLGRIDLRFQHRHSKRLYFAFEAKRLHVTYPKGKFSSEYATYAGPQGMLAFVDETYSKGFAASGMLGYVMDGRSQDAVVGLRTKIEKKRAELKLSPNTSFDVSGLSPAIQNSLSGTSLHETLHQLSPHTLRMLHLIVPVNQVSVATSGET
jgi:hypothetical protein